MKRIPLCTGMVAITANLLGCDRNPSVEIVGSYFPGWMLSLAAGVCLTGATHVLLRRARIESLSGSPVVLYPALLILFTCVIWLCIFA